MTILRSKAIDPFRVLLWTLALGLLAACGSAKEVSDLSYGKRRAFEHYYFEACKQKILGNDQRAISLFHLSLKEFPNSHAAMHELGLMYYLNEELVEAEEWSLKAIAHHPGYNHWYHLQLASIYSGMGAYQASAEVYMQMIEHEGKDQDLYVQAAAMYVNSELPESALDVLNRLENECGVSEESATRKEFILMRLGRHDEAIRSMKRLVEAHPNQLHYRGYLAETLLSAGKRGEAIDVLEGLLARDSTFGRGHQMLHGLYREQGDVYKAYTHLLAAFRSTDVPIGDKLHLFTPYYLQMDVSNLSRNMVMELSDVLLQLYPESDVPFIVKGDVYTRLDSLETAREYFIQATERPSDHQVWNKLISIDGRMNRKDLQIQDASRAIERFPNIPGFYLAKGMAEYDSGLYRQSVTSCQDGLDLALEARDQIELHACLAMAYDGLSDVERSDEHFENALELSPDNALIMNNYAYTLAERGTKLDRALELVEAALQQEPFNPYYLDTKAWILFRLGKGEEAIPLLQRALMLDPDGLTYLEHLAQIHHNLGQSKEAQEYLERARAQGSSLNLP